MPVKKEKITKTINIGGGNGYKIQVKLPGKKNTKPDEVKSCMKIRNSFTSKGRRTAKNRSRSKPSSRIIKKSLFPVVRQSPDELRNKNIEIQQLYQRSEQRIFNDNVRKLTE